MVLHADKAGPSVDVSGVLRLGKLPGIHRGSTDVANFAGLDYIVEGLHGLFDRGAIVPPMDLIEVHIVSAKSPQTGVDLVHNCYPG